MEVDVKSLLIDLNFFAGDIAMRNSSLGRAKVKSMPDRTFDVAVSLNNLSFPTISWLKRQSVNTRECLRELQAISIDSYDGELYNTGEELLERLNAVTKPYTRSYVSFEELVNKSIHRTSTEESPAHILLKLADHVYDIPAAVAAFHSYLNRLEGRYSVQESHIKALREELEELEILSGLD